MPKFIGLHSLPGFTQEMMARARGEAPGSGIAIVRVLAESGTGRVICEVESPDRETFIAWLNKVNMPFDEVCQITMEMETNETTPARQGLSAFAKIKGLLGARGHETY